jgi:hypothetical protein
MDDFIEFEYYNILSKRILHGIHFKYYYAAIAVLSFVCLITSFSYKCPPPWFYSLEVISIVAMICEQLIRIFAVGNRYWSSWFNVLDAVIITVSFCMLLIVLGNTCGDSSVEAVFEEILLLGRNVLQFIRFGLMIGK